MKQLVWLCVAASTIIPAQLLADHVGGEFWPSLIMFWAGMMYVRGCQYIERNI